MMRNVRYGVYFFDFGLVLAREWVNGASDTAKIVGLFGEPFWSTVISKSYL